MTQRNTPPRASGFEPGDRVQTTRGGHGGTIAQDQPLVLHPATIMVLLDGAVAPSMWPTSKLRWEGVDEYDD